MRKESKNDVVFKKCHLVPHSDVGAHLRHAQVSPVKGEVGWAAPTKQRFVQIGRQTERALHTVFKVHRKWYPGRSL